MDIGRGKITRHRRARPGQTAVARARRRCGARMHRHLHQARGRGEAPRSRRQAGHHLGSGRRRRHDRRDGRQPRRAEARAPGHLERVVHDQLPRPGRLCAAPGDRHRARLYDDDPLLYRRPEPAGHPAFGSAPGARREPVADPDLDRGREGGRAGAAGAEGQARRHRDPGPDRQRLADRLQVRRGARNLGRARSTR